MPPSKVFLTKGVGKHKEKLASFELALRDAGIADYNIVRVTSILPPHAQLISKEKGIQNFKPGQIIYCVMAENVAHGHKPVGVSLAVAIPKNRNKIGYFAELMGTHNETKDLAKRAEDLASMILETIIGIDVAETRSVLQVAQGDKDLWTTVVASAVFC
jgi:arginine decarboxylase